MAGVFKSLDQSDVRITPFRTHKQWLESNILYTISATTIDTTAGQIYELKTTRAVDDVSKRFYYYYHTGLQELTVANKTISSNLSTVSIPNVVTGSWTYLPNLIKTNGEGYVGYVNAAANTVVVQNTLLTETASIATIPTHSIYHLTADGLKGLAFNQESKVISVYGTADASGSGEFYVQYDVTASAIRSGSSFPTGSTQTFLGGVADPAYKGFYSVANLAGTGSATSLVRYVTSSATPLSNKTLVTPQINSSNDGVKDIVCTSQANTSCSVFITFKQTPGLWTTYENNVPVKHPWNVANLLADKSDYISGSGWVTDRRVHAVLKDGTIVLDLTVDSSNNFSYGETISCGHYVGSGEVKAAVINTDVTTLYTNGNSIITVYGVTTTNTAYVYHYNVTTETLSPITHLGRLPYKGFGDGGTSTINLLAAYREDSTIGLLHTVTQTPNSDSPNLYTFST